MDFEKLLTIEEASKILRVSKKTIYRFIHERGLKAVKMGRAFVIKESDLKTFIDEAPTTNRQAKKYQSRIDEKI